MVVLFYAVAVSAAAPVDMVAGFGAARTGGGVGAYGFGSASWGPAEALVVLGWCWGGAAVVLALFVPSLAVTIRRLHDTERSGWWLFLLLPPFVGGIVLFVFFCLEGTQGPNRFGADPKTAA